MKICDLYKNGRSLISFEVFPPQKEAGAGSINNAMDVLAKLKPAFISVTYSAGGSDNHEKTIEIASRIQNKHNIPALAHLTCINSSREQVTSFLKKLDAENLQNIMALRGDTNPCEQNKFSEYRFAKDLIAHINHEKKFCIGAAAYPEGHIDCETLDESIAYQREKLENGAKFFISQLFFDNDVFFRYLEKARKAGINVPISAGIMPILSRGQIEKMIFLCGTSLPSKIIRILRKYENDPQGLKSAGIDHASEQINALLAQKVDGVHIYTMNRPEIACECVKRMPE